MAIARQSDSIWAVAAMGEGRQDHAYSETHDKAVSGSRNYGHALGEKHASEAWHTENRDEHGRFAATPEHHRERHEAEGKQPRGDQRDKFAEGYHTGFKSHISKKEQEKKRSQSSMLHRAVEQDTHTGELDFNDGLDEFDRKYLTRAEKQDRFRHYLTHGTYEGWKPETAMDRADRLSEQGGGHKPRPGVTITDRNPAATELDSLKYYTEGVHGVPLSDKQPFSAQSYANLTGGDPTRKSRARGKLPKGSLASEPLETTDQNGVKHTFWHQVSTEFPIDNPNGGVDYQTEYPGAKNVSAHASPRLTVALHHHRSDTGLQHPLVSNHTLGGGSDSASRESDLHGMFRTNDQTRLLHQIGVQRIGDWNNEIKFDYKHPNGQIRYTIQRVNGDDSRFKNGRSGMYYDPELGSKTVAGEKHPDYVGEKWVVTPRTQERVHSFDPRSEVRNVAHSPIEFSADDDHGFNSMIQHVLGGRGTDELSQPYSRNPQSQMPHNEGLPPERFNPRSGARSWSPEHNIHRSAERLPISF